MKAAILKSYPSEVTIVFFYILFGTIQCAVVALIAERNPDAWRIRPGIELITVMYTVSIYTIIKLHFLIRSKNK